MSVDLSVCASSPDRFPYDGLPEIAFVGRSNVGKSSLLNTMVLRGKRRTGEPPITKNQLAFTSRTPGRTQAINFYKIDGRLYFVDLPGYGYAKAPKSAMEDWRRLAEAYLIDRATLRLVVLIVDARHGPTALDRQMKEWLLANEQPFLVAASKIDKLKRSQRQKAVRAIENDFHPPVAFSAASGEGVPALWDGIRKSLER